MTETGKTTPSAPPAGGRTFAWAPVPGAVAYQFHLIRDDDLVFTARLATPSLTLPVSWRHEGRDRHLDKGAYRWVVWPIMPGLERAGGEGNRRCSSRDQLTSANRMLMRFPVS